MAGRIASTAICRRNEQQKTENDLSFERENVRQMQGYASGEQPDQPDVIKLNTNENPYPPGARVAQALADLRVENLRRYPPPTALNLRRSLSALHGVDPDNILVTNGGDELLRLLLATFVEPDESIATASPSYSLYDVLAAAHGCSMQHFPLQENWQLDPLLATKLNAAAIKLCFIVNPHAPSGVLIPYAELDKLASTFKGLLVLDEAYVDFVDPALEHDCTPLVLKYDNVLILRTFSKGYSLAGLRMAYGIGALGLIDPMQHKTKDSYNTDYIAQTLAQAAIEDRSHAAVTWKKVREERTRLREALQELGLDSPPSQSNFLLAQVPAPHTAEDLYKGLKQSGILVRWFNIPGLSDRLRITVGTAGENQRLLTALQSLLGKD
jgi:histidinol-phosphate aminotransferase